jgi:phosphoenolpyruvate carboxykinase (ATP)
MEIKYTRAMLNAALDGKLDDVPYVEDPIFKVHVPTECPGVPNEVLIPENTWQDKEAYRQKAKELAAKFAENFKQYEAYVSEEVKKAGPEA